MNSGQFKDYIVLQPKQFWCKETLAFIQMKYMVSLCPLFSLKEVFPLVQIFSRHMTFVHEQMDFYSWFPPWPNKKRRSIFYPICSKHIIRYKHRKRRGEENKSRIYERYAVRLVFILFLTKNRRCGVLATGTPPFIQNRFLKIHDDTIHSI